jgi:hypothetical protein
MPIGSRDDRVFGGVTIFLDFEDESSQWLDQARLTLQSAEVLLVGGLDGEAIADAFLAMLYAARATLDRSKGEISGREEVVGRFQSESLPGLGLSKGNQRALPIVADLYRRITSGEMESDPLTASACLEDARSFVDGIESKMNT